MNSDVRHVSAGQYWKIIEIALNNAAACDGDLLVESFGYSECHLHLDLSLDSQRVHQKRPSVHRNIDAFNLHVSTLADRNSRYCRTDSDFGSARPAIVTDSDAHSSSGRQLLSPPRLLGGGIQNLYPALARTECGIGIQQGASILIRILARRNCDFVDESLHTEFVRKASH